MLLTQQKVDDESQCLDLYMKIKLLLSLIKNHCQDFNQQSLFDFRSKANKLIFWLNR